MTMLEGGTLIAGRYRLGEAIGSGSTGTVWSGQDLISGAPVALKVLHPGLFASTTARQRFGREASAAQSLVHPHWMRIEADGVTDDGRPYLVMERLRGQTLTTLLRTSGVLAPARAIRIVAQILDALGAAHRIGLVHRDLKADNVMVSDGGPDAPDVAKVCDFGLAKYVHGDDDGAPGASATVTWPGEICGTPEYMAPEQARGEPLDARADLYAVAVILFQVITGTLPFSGRSPLEVVSQQLGVAPPRPSELRPELRQWPALEKLILRALSKDRRERPSSAEVFRADLLQVERDHEFEIGEKTSRGAIHAAETLRSAQHLRRSKERRRVGRHAPVVVLAAVVSLLLIVADRSGSAPRPHTAFAMAPAVPVRAHATIPAAIPPPARAAAPVEPPAPARRGSRRARKLVASAPAPAEVAPAPRQQLDEAEELLAAGEIARACVLGEEAVHEAPQLARARAFLGRCYMRLGRTTEARAHYARYLALQPTAVDAPFVRAIVGQEQP